MVKLSQIITLLALAVASNAAKKCSHSRYGTASIITDPSPIGSATGTITATEEIPIPTPTPTGNSGNNTITPGNNIVHGLGYNAKHSDGKCPELAKVVEDFNTMKKVTNQIRTFGLMDCDQGRLIVEASAQTDMKVYLGMFLNQYPQEFENEFAKLKELISKHRSTFEKNIGAIIVGSETLYRKELTFDQLAVYITKVKTYIRDEAKLNIEITTADTKDQWYPHATLDAVDFLMVNAYPYWESIPVEQSIEHLFNTIGKVKGATQKANKRFVLGETGWPIGGKVMGAAVPSQQNQLTYFNQFYCRAKAEGLEYYWFSAFDESWKQDEAKSDWGLFKEGGITKSGYTFPPQC